MDPLQWMGAVRRRAQTSDKNITIIHTTVILMAPIHCRGTIGAKFLIIYSYEEKRIYILDDLMVS